MSDAYSEFTEMCDEIEEALERGEIAPPINYHTLYEQAQQEKAELVEALEAAMDFINKHPADPDITADQAEAWLKLQKLDVPGLLSKHRPDAWKQANDR